MSVMLECQAVKVTNSEPGLGDITAHTARPDQSWCVRSEEEKAVCNFPILISQISKMKSCSNEVDMREISRVKTLLDD